MYRPTGQAFVFIAIVFISVNSFLLFLLYVLPFPASMQSSLPWESAGRIYMLYTDHPSHKKAYYSNVITLIVEQFTTFIT